MQITIDGHHVELTESLQNYVNTKLKRIERHFDRVVDVHVVMGMERTTSTVEATVHLAGNHLHAHAEHEDMYAAIDALIDKLDRQVKKHKEKKSHHRP
ncbi:MAG: ribosome-associated translation inhibitor RaiA [Pseudomonadota bacterium]